MNYLTVMDIISRTDMRLKTRIVDTEQNILFEGDGIPNDFIHEEVAYIQPEWKKKNFTTENQMII